MHIILLYISSDATEWVGNNLKYKAKSYTKLLLAKLTSKPVPPFLLVLLLS